MARSGKSPYLSLKEVYELGFDYALCPIEPMFAMHKAVKEMMEIMLREGLDQRDCRPPHLVRRLQ